MHPNKIRHPTSRILEIQTTQNSLSTPPVIAINGDMSGLAALRSSPPHCTRAIIQSRVHIQLATVRIGRRAAILCSYGELAPSPPSRPHRDRRSWRQRPQRRRSPGEDPRPRLRSSAFERRRQGRCRPIPRDVVGLAINSQKARSQNQLHIHIDCVMAEVIQSLDDSPALHPGPAFRRGRCLFARGASRQSISRATGSVTPDGSRVSQPRCIFKLRDRGRASNKLPIKRSGEP
jgi:hypothetical protein